MINVIRSLCVTYSRRSVCQIGKLLLISCAFSLCIGVGPAQSQSVAKSEIGSRRQEFRSGKYVYVFREKAAVGNDEIEGIIEVMDLKGAVVWREQMPPADPCELQHGLFQKVTVSSDREKKELVVICSSDAGRNNNLIVFDGSRPIGRLNLGRSGPATSATRDGILIVEMYLLHAPPHQGGWAYSFMIFGVDPWDKMDLGFQRVFNSQTSAKYRKAYEDVKKEIISLRWSDVDDVFSHTREPALAALVGTQDARYICSEARQIGASMKMALSDFKEIIRANERRGYPTFDMDLCKSL